jgi:hypothetical protein
MCEATDRYKHCPWRQSELVAKNEFQLMQQSLDVQSNLGSINSTVNPLMIAR